MLVFIKFSIGNLINFLFNKEYFHNKAYSHEKEYFHNEEYSHNKAYYNNTELYHNKEYSHYKNCICCCVLLNISLTKTNCTLVSNLAKEDCIIYKQMEIHTSYQNCNIGVKFSNQLLKYFMISKSL